MGFGILEPKDASAHVPGTTLLDVHEWAVADSSRVLKKGTGRNSHVVLVPQPSDDPNDPLNWPLWTRDLLLTLLLWGVVVVIGGAGPMMSPIAVPLIDDFKIGFKEFSLLSGYCLLATGAIGVFIAAGTRKYGKRPTWILSTLCAFVGCIWAAAAKSYGSFMGARILQGLSMACFESISYAFIGDLYFVHERATRTAIVVICYQSISNVPALVAGTIASTIGWRWCFWLLGLFAGLNLLLIIPFGWETAYKRGTIDASDITNEEVCLCFLLLHTEDVSSSSTTPRQSFGSRLRPIQGVYSRDSLLKLILTPFGTLVNPATIWAVITLSFPVLWLVGLMLVIAQIFSVPPYNLNPTQLGYMWTGPIVVGFLACAVAGPVSDWSAKWFSRRNSGKYEPEFRLLLVLGMGICCSLGYYLFGYLLSQQGSVTAISVVFGFCLGGAQFSAVCVGSYVNDAYASISIEVFIIIMVIKNFLFYGFSLFINEWVELQGPQMFFYTIGGIQLALCFVTVPLYIYGKRVRLWWSKLAFAKKLVARD